MTRIMTEQEQRIALAEFEGWTKGKRKEHSFSNPSKELEFESWIHPNGYPERRLPDYLHDLNAVHEVEKKFLDAASLTETSTYLDNLYRANGLNPYVWRNAYGSGDADRTPPVEMALIVSSDASKRCEAILKTLGKWKD